MKILLALAFLGASYIISLIMLFSSDAADRGSRVGKAVCTVMVAISFVSILPFACYEIHNFFFRKHYNQCLNDEIEYKCKLLEDAYSHQDCSDNEASDSTQSTSAASAKPQIAPVVQTNVVTQGYCKLCGCPLNAGRKCTGCGKQYFHIKKGFLLKLYAVCMTFVAVAAIGCSVYNYGIATRAVGQQVALMDERDSLQGELLETEKKRKNLQRMNTSLQSDLDDKNSKLFFYENNAVIVTKTGKKYHKYGCYHLLRSDGIWIYNTEAAKGRGYTACADCWK